MCICSQGLLGSPSEFRRTYEVPILAGREPGASPEQVAAGETASQALSTLVNHFVLRRTNTLLSAHLPPKVGHSLILMVPFVLRLDSKLQHRSASGLQ
jgi:hypothetical protein